jgi:hypothetical protein
MLIFGFLIFITTGTKFENSTGSLRFLYLMSTLSLLINLVHNLASLLFWLVGFEDAVSWQCMGFWNIAFCFLTIECLMVSHVGS